MKSLTSLSTAFCASIALALTAFGGPEPIPSGKEMKQVAPTPPECDYSWTGFYFGGNAGYGWGDGDTHFQPLPDAVTFFALEPTTLSPDPGGFIGGGQIGYNWEWCKWLILGIETDFQGTDIEGSEHRSPIIDITGSPHAPDSFLFAHERVQRLGTVRGRVGFSPVCRLLIYGTGGFAYGNVDYSANTDFTGGTTYPVDFSDTRTGWAAGGGAEWALTHHWSIRVEYLRYDLGDADRTEPQLFFGVPTGTIFSVRYRFDTSGNIVRGGLNFKF